MNLTKLLNMTRSHILRIILCSIGTIAILLTVNTFNRVFTYIFLRWNLDLIQNNINSNVPFEIIIIVIMWNYIIGFVVAGLLWRYVGLPKITVVGKFYKRFVDVYYEDI